MENDPRQVLDALIRERREDYASLSRMIGRNSAYIQQYVKRGTPRRLAEEDRRELASFFGVPESLLGGPADERVRVAAADAGGGTLRQADLVAIPRFAVGASAGPGALPAVEQANGALALPPRFLRELGASAPDQLSVIGVVGDSMLPTLADGDDILVDRGDAADRLRDGVYALRSGDALLVKRVTLAPDGSLTVGSDNPAYPRWPNADRSQLVILGRVLWASRRIR